MLIAIIAALRKLLCTWRDWTKNTDRTKQPLVARWSFTRSHLASLVLSCLIVFGGGGTLPCAAQPTGAPVILVQNGSVSCELTFTGIITRFSGRFVAFGTLDLESGLHNVTATVSSNEGGSAISFSSTASVITGMTDGPVHPYAQTGAGTDFIILESCVVSVSRSASQHFQLTPETILSGGPLAGWSRLAGRGLSNVPPQYRWEEGAEIEQYDQSGDHEWSDTFVAFANPGNYSFTMFSLLTYCVACYPGESSTETSGTMHVSTSLSFERCLTITQQPAPLTELCQSSVAVLTIGVTGPSAAGVIAYQWQWRPSATTSWTDVQIGLNSRGGGLFTASDPHLSAISLDFSPGHGLFPPAFRPEFHCIVSNACTSKTSNTAILTGCEPCCPADADLLNPNWNATNCSPNDQSCIDHVLNHNNCFSYAMNRDSPTHLNPRGLPPCPYVFSPQVVRHAAEAEGLSPAVSGNCEDGCLVALFVKPGRARCDPNEPDRPDWGDYHWWRKNNDGSWSDKQGWTDAKLVDPGETTHLGYMLVDYYCVPCSFQLQGEGSPLPDPVPSDSARVTPNALSGMQNPYFETRDMQLLDLLRLAMTSGSIQTPAPPQHDLEFSGFSIDVGTAVAGLPPKFGVRNGQIQYRTENGVIAREDVLGVAQMLDSIGTNTYGWGCLIHQRCPADRNCSGAVDSQDFFDFLSAFFTEGPVADFNFDGFINSQDFFDFLAAFFSGC